MDIKTLDFCPALNLNKIYLSYSMKLVMMCNSRI